MKDTIKRAIDTYFASWNHRRPALMTEAIKAVRQEIGGGGLTDDELEDAICKEALGVGIALKLDRQRDNR